MAVKRPINVTIAGDYNDKDVNRAIKDLQSLKTQGETTNKGFGDFSDGLKKLGGVVAATFTVGAAVDFFKSSIEGALEDQKSMVALAKAMENVGVAGQNAQVETFINKLSLARGVADDELRPALQKLITATGDVQASQKMLGEAMDISAATGRDLGSVSKALAMAEEGHFGALTKMGIPLSANIIKTKDFAAAQKVLDERFGGQSAAAAETYQGKMNRLTVAVNEAKEAIGYALLNSLDGVTTAMGGVDGASGAIADTGQAMAAMITQSSKLLASIATLIPKQEEATASQENWFAALIGNVGPVGKQAEALLNLALAYQKVDEAQSAAWKALPTADATNSRRGIKVWDEVTQSFVDPALINLHKKPKSTGTGTSKAIADNISATMQEALDLAGGKIQKYVESGLSGFGEAGAAAVKSLIDGLKYSKSQKTSDAIKKELQDAFTAANDTITAARDFGKSISDGIMGGLDIGVAASDWQTRQDNVKQALKDLTEYQKSLTAEATDAEKAKVAELQKVYQQASADAAAGGASIVDAFVAQAEKAKEFATKLQTLLKADLNPTTWKQIASMSADQGIKVADAFINGNMAQNIARANEAVGSMKTVADQVADMATKTFKQAGIEAAIAMLEAIAKALTTGNTRKGIMSAIASLKQDMASTFNQTAASFYVPIAGAAPVDTGGGYSPYNTGNAAFNDFNRNLDIMLGDVPAMASGGVVSGATLALIGEAGPEAVIPLNQMGGLGGNSYNITVQAGVGDPREIGQSIVEYISKFEKANGNVYAKAG